MHTSFSRLEAGCISPRSLTESLRTMLLKWEHLKGIALTSGSAEQIGQPKIKHSAVGEHGVEDVVVVTRPGMSGT